MSELFGAPSGIIASDENIRRNVLSGMQSMKMMGEIEQQPAEKALKESHARLYAAEAAGKEQEAKAAQQMLEMQATFARKEAERKALIEEGKAAGVDVTVADVKDGKRPSQAEALERFATFAKDSGAPIMVTAKIDKEIAAIKEKEAIAAYRNAQAGQQEFKQQSERLEQIGNIAGAAAKSPQAYMAIRSDPNLSKMLPPGLTGNFATDRGILESVMTASQDSIKRLDLERKLKEDAGQAARRNVQTSRDNAVISKTKAQEKLITERYTQLKKNGGDGSPSVVAAREARVKAQKAVEEARQRKEFPALPLDPKIVADKFKDGKGGKYTGNDGTRYEVVGIDAAGKPILKRLAIAPAAPAAAGKATSTTAEDTEDDDDDSDDE